MTSSMDCTSRAVGQPRTGAGGRKALRGDGAGLRVSKRFPSQKKIRVMLAMMTTPQTSRCELLSKEGDNHEDGPCEKPDESLLGQRCQARGLVTPILRTSS